MKNWNFEKQASIGILMLLCCFVLSTVTKQGAFSNAAWVLYGLLFVVHPVVPESAKWRYAGDEKKMKRHGRMAGALCILIGIITRFGV